MVKDLKEIPCNPLADFCLIELIPVGMTPGGLALPEDAQHGDARKGRVLKVGPGRVSEEGVTIPPNVKPGDVVYMFFAYSQPIEVPINGKKYIIARCRDLVATTE